jgi:hypothetical protein
VRIYCIESEELILCVDKKSRNILQIEEEVYLPEIGESGDLHICGWRD